MPKVLVLFFGDDDSRALADAATSGAKGIRFTEVDARAANKSTTHHKPLGTDRRLTEYDGVVLVSAERELSDESSAVLTTLFGDTSSASSASTADLSNVVIGTLGSNDALLDRAARSGAILVTLSALPSGAAGASSQESAARAAAVGARVAKVAGWVRHALGHEAAHEAAHKATDQGEHRHSQSHEHPHEHSDHHHH